MGLIAPISSVNKRRRDLSIGGKGKFILMSSSSLGSSATGSDGSGACFGRMGLLLLSGYSNRNVHAI